MRFRSERERLMVLGGALAMGVIIFLGFVVFPLLDGTRRAEIALVKRKAELEEARGLAARLVTLKAQVVARPTSLVQEVDRVTREMGINRDQVADLKVFGNKGVQLKIDDLDGATLVKLLMSLQRAGVYPDGLELHDPKGRGLWSVTLRVTGS